MNAAARRRATRWLAGAVLLAGAAWLAGLLGAGGGVHWLPPLPVAPLPPVHAAAAPLAAQPLESFAALWQKPLFNPDRQPAPLSANGADSIGDLRLTGVILTPTLRMALLDPKDDKDAAHAVRVRQGELLPDGVSRLVEVRPRSAVFDNGGTRTELQLVIGSTAGSGAQPAPALPGIRDPRRRGMAEPPASIQRLLEAIERHRAMQGGHPPDPGVP